MFHKKNSYKTLFENTKDFIFTIINCFDLARKASVLFTFARIILKILQPMLQILSAYILKLILDILTNNLYKIKYVYFFVIIFIFISIFSNIISQGILYVENLHTQKTEYLVLTNIINKSVEVDLDVYYNSDYYKKFQIAMRDSSSMIYILWNVFDSFSCFITLIISLTMLFNVNITYGIILLITTIPTTVMSAIYTKKNYDNNLLIIDDERKKDYIYQICKDKEYAQEIRLFNLNSKLISDFDNICKKVYCKRKKIMIEKFGFTTFFSMFPEITIGLFIILLTRNVILGYASIGDYSLYIGIITQLWSSMVMMTNSGLEVYENRLKLKNVIDFQKIKSKISDTGKEVLNEIKSIEFVKVCFRYPNTAKNILSDVSFKIYSKETIALVGINGSGKTTILKLLLRFYEINSGNILINKRQIQEYSLNSLRKAFGCYFQNSKNYSFTLEENIIISDKTLDDKSRVYKLIREVGADNILYNAQKGLYTYITKVFDNEGIELSGGENQKIALARSLYRKSQVMMFDEPSSALDPESEKKFFDFLFETTEKNIIIFTSHRLTNAKIANRIILLENGSVIEEGTQEELLKKDKRYAELFKYQQH